MFAARAEAVSPASTASLAFRAAAASVMVNGLWFVWSNRFIPNADFPDWLFQGHLVSLLLGGQRLPGSYTLHHYPVANSIPTVAMGAGDLLLTPEAMGKLLMSVVLIFFALASIYLLKSFNSSEENPALLVPLLYLFNCWFFFGELSYLIGLALLFLLSGYLFRRLDVPERASPLVVAAIFIALFFAHPIPFVIAGLETALFVWKSRSLRLANRFVIAIAPSTMLMCWYIAGRLSSHAASGADVWQFWTMREIVGRFMMAFAPFHEFLPWLGINQTGMHLAATINLLMALVAAIAIAASIAASMARHSFAPLMATVCFAGFIGAGYSFMGWIGPGERFIYPAAWFALCWLGAAWAGRERAIPMRALGVGLVTLLVGQMIYLDTGVATVSRQLAVLNARLNRASSQSEFCATYEAALEQGAQQPHRKGLDRFLNNVSPVLRLPYYGYLERGEAAPIFQVGLFKYDGPGNNENLCK